MNSCSAALRYGCSVGLDKRSTAFMTKRYQLVKVRHHDPSGVGFIDAFRMALVEFGCLGERHFDVSGYPHESSAHALMADWSRLGQDMRCIQQRLLSELSTSDGGGASQLEKEASGASTRSFEGTARVSAGR